MKALLNAFLESISNLKVHFLPFSRCITKELPPDGDSIGEDKLFFPAQNVVIGGNFYMTVFFMHSESDRETIINLFICLFLVFALTLTDGGRHSKLFLQRKLLIHPILFNASVQNDFQMEISPWTENETYILLHVLQQLRGKAHFRETMNATQHRPLLKPRRNKTELRLEASWAISR